MNVNKRVLEKFLEERFGDSIIKSGNEWILPSFEKPSKYKLYFNVENGLGIDFIGNVGYSARTLIGKVMNIEDNQELDTFIMDYTMKHLRLVDVKDVFNDKKQEKKIPPPVQRTTLPAGCVDLGSASASNRRALDYLNKRGIDRQDIERFHLKFCTEGKYRNRIIIPFIENNEIIWWQGRAIHKWMSRYDNPVGVAKSMLVYNIDAITDVAVVTEGPFDAIKSSGQAIMGSSLSEWQTVKILSKKPKKIIVVPDNDFNKDLNKSVGYIGALKSVERLIDNGFPLSSIFVAFIEQVNPNVKDLGELSSEDAKLVIDSAQNLTFSVYYEFVKKNARNPKIEKLL